MDSKYTKASARDTAHALRKGDGIPVATNPELYHSANARATTSIPADLGDILIDQIGRVVEVQRQYPLAHGVTDYCYKCASNIMGRCDDNGPVGVACWGIIFVEVKPDE